MLKLKPSRTSQTDITAMDTSKPSVEDEDRMTSKSSFQVDDMEEESKIPSAQREMVRPSFSDSAENEIISKDEPPTVQKTVEELRRLCNIKYNLNTIQEGLTLAKGSRELPQNRTIVHTKNGRTCHEGRNQRRNSGNEQ